MPEQPEKQQPLSRASLDITLANMFSSKEYQNSYVFYGHMVGQCSIILERMKAPAAVSFHLDHYKLHINPELFDKFSLQEQLGVIKHEMLHILNGHVVRKEDRDHQAFNYSTDCAINQLIDRSHLPQGCIFPDNFPSKKQVPIELSSEQYYELLDKEQLPPEEPDFGHDKWEESQGDEELQKDITKNMIEKAISQTQKSKGDLPNEISDYLEMFSRKAELDWKKVLRGILGNKKVNSRKTIMRRDRRNPDFAHIKGNTKDRIVTPVIVGDESGSVDNAELTQAIGECLYLCKAVSADLWYVPVDSRAHTPHILKKNQRTFKRTACGGTVLAPAITKTKEAHLDTSCYVVITDGEICESDIDAFDATNKPVIWLITSKGTLQPSMTKNRMKGFKLKAS